MKENKSIWFMSITWRKTSKHTAQLLCLFTKVIWKFCISRETKFPEIFKQGNISNENLLRYSKLSRLGVIQP
jgi:hypothetical protein